MELTAEQIKDYGLAEENVPKVNSFLTDQIADQIAEAKKGFEGKANTDAEAILTGASEKILKDTSIERKQGEKMGDYIPRAWDEFNTVKISEVSKAKADYETKLKDFKGDKDLISKISTLEGDKDGLLKKFADYDEVKERATKYNPLKEEFEANKIQVAFSLAKPNFPDTVNSFEADARWMEFKSGVLDKYDIVFDKETGKWMAVDKDNPHRSKVLSDLAANDETLSKLSKGRIQKGPGGKPITKIQIEGVPFDVPENVDNQTKTELIKEYLTKTKGLSPMSAEYSTEFAKYNKLINEKKLKKE